jgi:2-keto-4-pentenoate hydratase/2-oxohepta-3-ene-1,7-dioic acid hydratase in catechol pathway
VKLLRYGQPGHEKPALLDHSGQLRDLSVLIPDLAGHHLSPQSLDRIAALNPNTLPAVSGHHRLGPCVSHSGKFICIGLNYSDHAAETGNPAPAEPVVFMKATSAIMGPNDNVVIPRHSKKTDWEVELGVVIGSHAKYTSEANALQHVAGYCVINDLSERAFQLESTGQWTKGKSADTFGPIGPWLVTKDEVPDPQNLKMWLKVNDHPYQNGSTKTMIFSVAHIVSYLSRFMSLHPGDIISTGTPPGVGMGQKPQVFLKPGDKIHLGIQGLGEQNQTVIADPSS